MHRPEWAGDSHREDYILRSVPPGALASLVFLVDVESVSLQVEVPLRSATWLTDHTAEICDSADSGALLR